MLLTLTLHPNPPQARPIPTAKSRLNHLIPYADPTRCLPASRKQRQTRLTKFVPRSAENLTGPTSSQQLPLLLLLLLLLQLTWTLEAGQSRVDIQARLVHTLSLLSKPAQETTKYPVPLQATGKPVFKTRSCGVRNAFQTGAGPGLVDAGLGQGQQHQHK